MTPIRRLLNQYKNRGLTSAEELASIVGCSRATMYKTGASQCKTYAELWAWVKENKPEKMKILEENYEMAWQHDN